MTSFRLKTWPQQFQEIKSGKKTFELRGDDKGFDEGDVLHLEEWDPKTQKYTGDRVTVDVTHVMDGGQFGLKGGFVAMSIRLLPNHTDRFHEMVEHMYLDWRNNYLSFSTFADHYGIEIQHAAQLIELFAEIYGRDNIHK